MAKYFRWAELPERTDVDTWEGTTRWGNHDLYPIPMKERTYGRWGFFSYYGTSGISVSSFQSASAYVAAGLSCWETVGAILLGACIAALSSFLGARPGIDKSLGYTMMARVTFGFWGAFIPLAIVLTANVTFAGISAYQGGQAVTIILGAVIPQFHTLPNTIPASAGITTQNLIGFFLFFVFYGPVVYFVPLHRLRKFMYPSIVITAATFLGMLGWIIHQNGGTGPLIASPIVLTSTNRAFLFLQCTTSTCASWGGSGDRLSDWTRFSRTRHASTPALLTGLPVTLTITSIVGVLTTSAFYAQYKQVIWTPLGMLLYVQQVSYTPICRAATFFAGIGLLSSLIYIDIVQNTVAFGMDFAGLLPKYISMKRGAILLALLSVACNPWRFLNQAAIFITVLSTFAIFSSVTSPILTADYWLVRKKAWKVPDLYHENGIYWYFHGFNPRSLGVWFCTISISITGAVHSVMGGSNILGVDFKMYQITYFIGAPVSVALYVLVCRIFPPPGLGVSEDINYDRTGEVIDGIANGELDNMDAKSVIVETKTKNLDENF